MISGCLGGFKVFENKTVEDHSFLSLVFEKSILGEVELDRFFNSYFLDYS